MQRNNVTTLAAVALCALGLMLPYWPLCVLGLVLAAGWGSAPVALCIGFFLDVLYGAPIGVLHFLVMPWFLFAVALVAIRFLLVSALRTRGFDRL